MTVDHVVVWRVKFGQQRCCGMCVRGRRKKKGAGGGGGEPVLKQVLLCVSMLPKFTAQWHFSVPTSDTDERPDLFLYLS